VLQRIDNDSHMPPPRDQVARVRVFHSLKIFIAGINLEGTRVRIIKPSIRVNLMNEMRAVTHGRRRLILLPGHVHD
jgi:hypothetical protein